MNTEPKLAPPGAGLPTLQTLFLRYLVVPLASRKTSWEEDLQKFSSESEKILKLLEQKLEMEKKILVPPLAGLEDSSRYWSITETVEHLLIVGEEIKKCIQELCGGSIPKKETKIAEVKPKGKIHFAECKAAFISFTDRTPRELLAIPNRTSPLKYPHPWFGSLDAKQWCWLLGIHQGIHRKQIEAIAGLQGSQAKTNKYP
jgi:hypothetical protein